MLKEIDMQAYTSPAMLIQRYIALRDEVAELKAEFKAAEDARKNEMAEIESMLKTIMGDLGMESVRTESGTAYLKEATFVTTADKTAFLEYIRENERWDLLDIRGSKSNIQDYMLEENDLPPGIDLRRELTVGIRRA
jgi:hypothetical protein